MQISLEKFLKLTAVLAGSATIASACTIETTDGGSGGKGGVPGAGGASQGGSAGLGSGGLEAGAGGVSAGAPNLEGGAPSADGGAAGNAGAAGSTAFEGGAGGEVSVLGGAGGAGGEAGASCVSGSPAAEGVAFDCSTLPYAQSLCPNPSGEGLPVLVPASEVCERYSHEREGSVQVLVQCLSKLAPTDLCSATGAARAAACERTMQESTCVSSEAVAACSTIHAACGAVSEATCIADLSPLSDARIGSVKSCVTSSTSTECAYTYRTCRGLPHQALAVSTLCATLTTECPALTLERCRSGLDIYESGMILDLTYYSYRDCMAKSTGTCDAAFAACTQ